MEPLTRVRALFLDKEASSKKEKPLDGLFDTATKICVFICEDAEQLLQALLRRIIKILSRLFGYWSNYLFKTAPFRHTIYIRITFKTKDYRSTLVYSDYIVLIVLLLVVVILKYCSSDLLR